MAAQTQQILHTPLGSGGHRKLIAMCGKFDAVSRRIWQTVAWNLEWVPKSIRSGNGLPLIALRHLVSLLVTTLL